MSDSTCTVEGCTTAPRARGMCIKHYGRWRRNDPSASKPCSIDGCAKPSQSRGWCSAHYQRWAKFGDAAHPVDERKATKIVDLENGDRICGQCRQQKPITSFHKDAKGARGRRGQCADCELANQKSYYLANQDRIVARQSAYRALNLDLVREQDGARYQRHKEKRIELATAHAQNRRARILGRELDKGITVIRLQKLYGDNCPYCSCRMSFKPVKRGEYNSKRASVEHLTPISKGGTHTWDNVVLACLGCNLSRGNRVAPGHVQQPLGLELLGEQEAA